MSQVEKKGVAITSTKQLKPWNHCNVKEHLRASYTLMRVAVLMRSRNNKEKVLWKLVRELLRNVHSKVGFAK